MTVLIQIRRILLLTFLCSLSIGVIAQEVPVDGADNAAVANTKFRLKEDVANTEPVSTTNDALKMLLGLGVVIGLIMLMAWFSRRLNMNVGTNLQGIKITSATSLGTKEKLIIVEVENQRLLLGVTATNISLLKDLAPSDDVEKVLPGDFSSKIKSLLKAKVSEDG